MKESNKIKTETHPCYSKSAHQYARMHIPVAEKCNISCNYCNRKYDCVHETRPGVTSKLLSPEEALARFKLVKSKVDRLQVVGVAGPGDALASFDSTKRSLSLIKNEDPDLTFCLSTNGLLLPKYQAELVELGISHVTITINAVEPKIGAQIYERVNYRGQTLSGETGAAVLLKNQLIGLKYLAEHGVICKVNIVLLKGINENHIEDIVKTVKQAGAYMTNIMPLIPVAGTPFADLPLTSKVELDYLRGKCEANLKQMYHCQQCRSDAVGCLSKDRSLEFKQEEEQLEAASKVGLSRLKEDDQKILRGSYYLESEPALVAVASSSGKIVDLHFGQAKKFYIYRILGGEEVELVEQRNVAQYCTDKECVDQEDQLARTIKVISDCKAVLSVRIGAIPQRKLADHNIKSVMVYDKITAAINYANQKIMAESRSISENVNLNQTDSLTVQPV